MTNPEDIANDFADTGVRFKGGIEVDDGRYGAGDANKTIIGHQLLGPYTKDVLRTLIDHPGFVRLTQLGEDTIDAVFRR